MSTMNLTNDDWVDFLYQNNIVEDEVEKMKRVKVVSLLESAVTSFVRAVMKENSYRKNEPTCKLMAFGSYGLGGYKRNADMDLVLICPWLIRRNNFFRIFPSILKHIATCRDVETIRRTTVPIIKCSIDNISIDISFVRLKLHKIPDNINLLDDSLLNDIDPVCVASMDGPRVNQFIKSRIRREHINIFQRCLQLIKHWASERQIYSKPVGYCNGSTWTLLLVKTYMKEKDNPDISITSLMVSFFNMWKDWPWPTPVLFTDTIPGKNGTKLNYQSLTEFEGAVFPIVSPCYPVCSTAPCVSKSTLKIITRELERATIILDYAIPPNALLTKLFHPINYFKRYDHFITVLTTSTTFQNSDIWTRRIAYNIPSFVTLLESCHDIEQLQPFTKCHTRQITFHTVQEMKALQLGYSPEEAKSIERTGQLQPGVIYLIYSFIGVKVSPSVKYVDISSQVESFTAILHSKRNKNDSDVHWSISVKTKKEVADILALE